METNKTPGHTNNKVNRNREQLGHNAEITQKYTAQLNELLLQNEANQSVEKQWEHIKTSIESAVSTTLDERSRQKTL